MDENYDEYETADGCKSCGIGVDELDIVQHGFFKLDYSIVCPYCGGVKFEGRTTWLEHVRNVWLMFIDNLRFSRKSANVDNAEVDNMADIPF